MFDADITVDFRATDIYLERLEQSQIPFTMAVTLTRLAQQSQKRIRRKMPSQFEIRSKRVIQGVRIKPARKADFKRGTINSQVLDIDEFMAIHTTGGIKRPSRHRYLSVPRQALKDRGHRTKTGKVKKRFKPSVMIAKIKAQRTARHPKKKGRRGPRRPFIMDINGQPVIAQRKSSKRFPLIYFWGMTTNARIRKRWPFEETVEQVVRRNYVKTFIREYKRNVRSARG